MPSVLEMVSSLGLVPRACIEGHEPRESSNVRLSSDDRHHQLALMLPRPVLEEEDSLPGA